MGFEAQASHASTRTELVEFLNRLADSYVDHPDTWENDSIDSYLRAWSAWLEDMDGYFRNRGETVPDAPSWQFIAQMLLAAKVYE